MPTKLEAELRNLATGAGWTHPFFLPPLSQTTMVEDPSVKTFEINAGGVMKFNPTYCAGLKPAQRVFAIFHEIMHPLSLHHERRQEREPGAWNIASDMCINHFLKTIGLQPPDGLFFPESGWEDLCAEEMYERVKRDPKWSQVAASCAQGSGQFGAGCACHAPQNAPANGAGPAIDWSKVAAQARAQAAGAGTADGLGRVLMPRPSGQRWGLFIRGVCSRANAEHGRDEQTWSRFSRRSPPGVILPGYRAVKARVAIAVDVSGSMSEEQRARCLDEIQAVARVGDAKVFLVVHTSEVVYSGWLDARKRELISAAVDHSGGTDFAPAYAVIEKEKVRFDAMVHLTDGCNFGDWPGKPINCKKLIAALLIPANTPGVVQRPSGCIDVEVRI